MTQDDLQLLLGYARIQQREQRLETGAALTQAVLDHCSLIDAATLQAVVDADALTRLRTHRDRLAAETADVDAKIEDLETRPASPVGR